ncbi:MAG TPA: protein kinase, partial [Kofleriaceae bacterium]
DRAYLLMERLRGADLESRLERGPLPLDRALLFMRQAAGAIGAAHERGIVHRDLKPANLFVVEDPDVIGGERVKVLDFGIAKLTADSGGGKTQGVFGSPPYMSPEQCASTGAVDARSDLYSLGCIFYELVCGRPPFGHGGIELIASHLRDVPPPPRAIAHWVPPAIERVILALLEKQPDRRIPSCAALVAALDEAAAASGLPGFSSPHLPAGTGGISTAPPRGPHTGHPATTLGGAASTAATQPPRRRLGAWLGIAAVVVVGGAVTAVMTLGGHPAGGPNPPPQGASDGGIAIAPVDAGASDAAIAVAPADAALIAAIVPDAADTEATPPDPPTERGEPRTDKPRTDKPRADPRPKATTGERVCDTIDVDAVMRDAANAYAQGLSRAALAYALKAVTCKPSTRLYRFTATYACAAHDFESTKQYLAKLPSGTERSQVEQKCQQEGMPAPSSSPSQAEIAARFNEEGKELLYHDQPDAAAKKFLDAIARVPEAKYFVNLCVARFQGGRFDEALTACEFVDRNNPTADQRRKATTLIERIRAEAKKQGIELH